MGFGGRHAFLSTIHEVNRGVHGCLYPMWLVHQYIVLGSAADAIYAFYVGLYACMVLSGIRCS